MTRAGQRRLTAVACAGTLLLAGIFTQGCATTDCSETATCPDPDEASTEAGVDASADDGGSGGNVEGATESGVDSGADGGRLDTGETSPGDGAGGGAESSVTDATIDATIDAGGGGSPDASDATAETGGDATGTCVPTGREICNNGIDDDCNGLTDCADRVACPTFACAAPVATGWVGPALLWTGPFPATQVPACPGGYQAVDAFQGVMFPNDRCSCACTPSGQQCSPNVTAYTDQACSLSCTSVSAQGTGACTPLRANTCGSNGSFIVTTPTPGGTCTPQVTATDGGAPSWTSTVRLCTWVGAADSPGGCTATGAQCVPDPAPFGSVCVYHSGAGASCPTGYDAAAPIVVYSGTSDQRGCSGCTCGALTGASCSGSVRLYGGSACIGTGVQNAASCTMYGVTPSPGSVKATYTLTPGACSIASQPVPIGSVVPTGPTTVCCR